MPAIATRAGASARAYGFTATSGLDIPTLNLQLYLDASNSASYSGSGTNWKDLSGNGRNFNWTSTPSFNSSGVKYFNASGKQMLGPASNSFGIGDTTSFTLFFTMYQNSLTNNTTFNWDGNGGRGIFSHCTWSDGNIYWDGGGCCGSDTRVAYGLPNATGKWHVIAYRRNYAATSRSIWDTGSMLGNSTAGIANIGLNGNAVFIGDGTWNGLVANVALYNRSLSDSELVTVTNTLKAKVGL